MTLTKKKEQQLSKMPKIETTISKSEDGKWLIHKTSVIHVRPVAYYQAVLDGTKEESKADEESVSLEEVASLNEMPPIA